MRTLVFKSCRSTRTIVLPEEWIGEVIEPSSVPIVDEAAAVIKAALSHPIGSAPLNELVQPDHNVAVLTCHETRSKTNNQWSNIQVIFWRMF